MDDEWARPSILTSTFVTLLLMVFLSVPKSQAQVYELKCDGLHNPLGVESHVPHFSWENTLTHNGQRQTAYELEVASDSLALVEGNANLWRSGRIYSDEQIMVPYSGKRLSEKQLCFWRVRTWDEHNNCTAWSTPSRFAIGPPCYVKAFSFRTKAKVLQ